MKLIKVKNKFVPHWLTYKPEEVEKIIINKYQQGLTKSEIGLMLRDSYGIPSVKDLTGKSIKEILEGASIKEEIPEDLISLYRKAIKLHAHLEKEKKDKKSVRSLAVLENRINRQIKYYKRMKILPKDYEYSVEKARLVVKL